MDCKHGPATLQSQSRTRLAASILALPRRLSEFPDAFALAVSLRSSRTALQRSRGRVHRPQTPPTSSLWFSLSRTCLTVTAVATSWTPRQGGCRSREGRGRCNLARNCLPRFWDNMAKTEIGREHIAAWGISDEERGDVLPICPLSAKSALFPCWPRREQAPVFCPEPIRYASADSALTWACAGRRTCAFIQ